MTSRGPATLLLAVAALASGGATARAAVGKLSPNPPTPLPTGSAPGPSTTATQPAATTTTTQPTTTSPGSPPAPGNVPSAAGTLPRTGIDIPLELSTAAVLLAGGVAAGAAARARRGY